MAAAIVAMPTEATVATRTPPSTIGTARGSSTRRSRCQGGHPQCDRRLADPRIDALQPQNRVLDDRQKGIEHQRRQGRGLADLAPEGDQEEPEQGQAGDGLEHARDTDGGPFQERPARGQDAQRHAHQDRERHGLDDQLEMSRRGPEQGPPLR